MRPLMGLSIALLVTGCATHPGVPDSTAEYPSFFEQEAPTQSYAARPEDVLMHAIGLVGTPYQWGGNTPDSGFDCSGLIRYVFAHSASVNLPRTTEQMWAQGGSSISRRQMQSGDVVFFATMVANESAMRVFMWEKGALCTPLPLVVLCA